MTTTAPLLPSPQQGTVAAGAARPAAAAPASRPRFAPEHPLSLLLANQAVNAGLYGDAHLIDQYRQL